MKTKSISGALIAAIMSASMMLVGCAGDDIGGGPAEKANAIQEAEQSQDGGKATAETIAENVSGETFDNSEDGGHAIEVDGQERSYSNATVTKTGEADGDEADFYGENSAVFATNGGKLTLTNMKITTNIYL